MRTSNHQSSSLNPHPKESAKQTTQHQTQTSRDQLLPERPKPTHKPIPQTTQTVENPYQEIQQHLQRQEHQQSNQTKYAA